MCLGIICFGVAGYLALTGGGIRPLDQKGGLNEPGQTEIPNLQSEDPVGSPAPPDTPPLDVGAAGRHEGVYTFILAGTDFEGYNSDVLMVAALDTVNGTLNVLDIPRDTQVAVQRHTKKINAAWGIGFTHGGVDGGISQLKEELKSVIGFEPDAWAVVDLDGFVRLVDAIGGVDFDVPQNMNYEDPSQNLYIHLQKGPQHLDGAHAIQLVRFRRYIEGDLKRVQVQQAFLGEVFRQTVTLKNVFKLPEFVQIAQDTLRTDMTAGQMIWLGQQIMKLGEDSIHFYVLPGDPDAYYQSLNYFLVYRDEALALINETINPFTTPITQDNVNISGIRDR